MPEPFATLSSTLRELSNTQHGYDGTWGRMLVEAFTGRGLREVDGRGEVWTMRGGTDSAEWYVAALERALDVVPPEVFPPGFDPRARSRRHVIRASRILSPISVTAWGRKPGR